MDSDTFVVVFFKFLQLKWWKVGHNEKNNVQSVNTHMVFMSNLEYTS